MSKKTNREFKEFRKIPSLRYLYEINGDGSILRNVKSKRRIKQRVEAHNSKTKYWKCRIPIGEHTTRLIHNLVAECWLGPKPEGYQTDHIDRNSLNNDYHNLRYVTKSEQMLNRNIPSDGMTKMLGNLAKKNNGVLLEITLMRDGKNMVFSTGRQAAKFLAKQYPEKSEKCFTDKFHHRRKRIFDYDIKYRPYYLNETTRHGNLEKGKE